VDDAARLLAQLRRYSEAANLLLEHLGVRPSTATGLGAEQRRLALKAAIHLSRAGRRDEAVDLFVALGERQRAAELLERAGDAVRAGQVLRGGRHRTAPPGSWKASAAQKLEAAGQNEAALQAYIREGQPAEAARLARALGRPQSAAELYADAGMPYDAARAFLEAGMKSEGLAALVRVSHGDARYREAARLAAPLAADLGELGIHVEHFFTEYIRTGPVSDDELDTLCALGRLYLQRGFLENADEVLRKTLDRSPSHAVAQDLAARLEASREREQVHLKTRLEEDNAFWGRGADRRAADLPDLPDLPPLGATPVPEAGSPRVKGGTRILGGGPSPIPSVASGGAAAQEPGSPAASPEAEKAVRFEAGMLLAGRYELKTQIGEGGMATVFHALDLELDEPVAVKIFREALTDDDSLARFRMEIKLARQLQQPNVTRVYDIGVHGGHRYLTMELLVGESLEARLRRPIRLSESLDYLIQACAGLHAAHERGIIHRDIKPDNLFIADGGVVKVMDFGIAKQQATPGLTVMGTIAGTPEYMSPEQVNNFTSVTPSTDIYALGVIAYRMCTGQLPFTHEELVPLLMMQVQEPPPPPRALNPNLPKSLEAIILKLLEKEPRHRYESCRFLATELERVRDLL
jgi:serine/threonine-protein kinase